MFEEKIKEQLKALGLDDILNDPVKVQKIAAKVTSEEGIPKAILDYAVNSEADRRVSKARETIAKEEREKIEKEQKEKGAGAGDDPAKKPDESTDGKKGEAGGGNPDIGAIIAKAVADAVKPLTDRLATIEKDDKKKRAGEKALELMKKEGLSEKLFSYLGVSDTDTDDTIAEKVTKLKSDFSGVVQEQREKEAGESGIPAPRSGITNEQASESVKELASSRPFAIPKK